MATKNNIIENGECVYDSDKVCCSCTYAHKQKKWWITMQHGNYKKIREQYNALQR